MLHIYTMGSDESKMAELKNSASQANVKIHYVVNHFWNGYVDKLTTMKKSISHLPDDAIVCMIDAYDVLVYANEEEILKKFKEYDCNILFSGELTCYPEKNVEKYNEIYKKTKLPCNFKYVNSGGYIGYKKSVMNLYDWKPLNEIHKICDVGGDQTYLTQYFLEHANDPNVNVKIDMEQKIFQSMCKIEFGDFEFIQGRLHNKILDQYPCFVHFNGYSIYNLEILNLHNSKKENALQVFMKHQKKSLEINAIEHLHYVVPFFIMIDGVTQHNKPQK